MKITYANDDLEFDFEGRSYITSFEAVADYDYDPGCMYMRNGDPGYPPEESFEVTKVDADFWEVAEDGNEELVTDKELKKKLEDWLWNWCDDNSDVFEGDDYDYPEPEEEWCDD